MEHNLSDLLRQLDALTKVFSNLSEQLSQANKELQDSFIPPSQELIGHLSSSRQQFEELRTRTLNLATSFAVPSPKPNEIFSLKELASLLQDVRDVEKKKSENEKVCTLALKVLDSVLALTHCDNIDFLPLLECKTKARELFLAIKDWQKPELHPDAETLALGEHPFSKLLTLILDRKDADVEHLVDLQESVAQSFSKGRTLAMAAVTGKLISREDSSLTQVSASAVDSDEVVPQISHVGFETASSAKQPSAEKDFQASPDETPAPEAEVALTALLPETTEEPVMVSMDSLVAPHSFEVTQEETLAEISTISNQIEAIEENVTPPQPLPKVETRHDGPFLVQKGVQRQDAQLPYEFSLDDTAQQIAICLKSSTLEEQSVTLPYLIWQLLRENKLDLAFHIARYLESQSTDLQLRLPSWLIRVVALGCHVRYEVGAGEIAHTLMDDFVNFSDSYFVDGESEWNQAVSLLLAASALRPTLLAPITDASRILKSLRLGEGFNQLFEYCKIIADYGNQRCALNTTAIKKVKSQGAWEAEMASLRQQVEAWWEQAPLFNMIYGPAKSVWSEWLKPEQLIHFLLHPVKQDDLSKLEVAKQCVERLSYDPQINEEVKRTQREIGLLRGGNAITGMALGRIRLHIREAVNFVHRWIELQESRLNKGNNYSHTQAQQLKQDLSSFHEVVLKELNSFEQRNSSVLVLAGISCCRKAVEDIRTLFNPDAILLTEEPTLKQLLHSELLKTNLPMNEEWEPKGEHDLIVEEILELVAKKNIDWQQAFEARSDSRDHEATWRIIECLRANQQASIDIEEFERRREERLRECQDSLQRDIDDTRSQIEEAVALGILKEADRFSYIARIVTLENDLEKTIRFSEKHDELRAIRLAIEEKKRTAIESVRLRLSSNLGLDHLASTRISHLLDEGDVLTANEYIDMALRGESIEAEAEKDTFGDFFPSKVLELEKFMADNSTQFVIRQVRNRESFCGLDLRRPSGAQTDRAAEMLETWFIAKRNETIDEKGVHKIFNHLGFNVLEISLNPSGRRTWFSISAEPIQDKESCPVAAYGSTTNGHYRILCVWGRPNEEELLNTIGETSHGSPVFVFLFGRLTEQRRRDLARLCRERRRSLVVIDDTLLLYLCGESGSRLPVLFKCALPFTFLEPYATTAGLVPPEVFYGRRQERDSIIDPMGSCFIYGGRQLGKTALLRSVEQTFHKPHEGRIALWLDLKAYGIGYARPIDDIWSLLADEFKQFEAVPRSVPSNVSADKLFGHIRNWLEQDKKRRILLLLDEADRFLESDGRDRRDNGKVLGEFIRASRLKGLMDQTNRRFKVVFAGLHNVQRTTRLENHPLAHYGEPLCIGPLLDNGEWREARNLIKRPLASIGYELSDDLVTRILSQTNYYPSLIQLYCQELLRDVNKNHLGKFDSKSSPPYQITSQQVEEAYQSQNLRKAIRDRFMWTLQLDQRYEVIAYSIAYDSLQESQKGVDGFSVSRIQEAVLAWWCSGFQGKSTDEIRALLEEMVGLGVLRVTNEGGFALRSPNVVLLMGTEDEIEAALLRSREAPLEYEPTTFRLAPRQGDISRRSPLTAQQESELRSFRNGVSIIFGCQAAGLDELKDFLLSAFGQEFFIHIDNVLEPATFAKYLNDLENREKDGTTLLLVSPTCPWSERWVNEALEKVSKLKSKKSFARVVFVADPQTTWQLVSQKAAGLDPLISKGVTTFSLKPWHDAALRQWLEDCAFVQIDQQGRAKITAVTGNWPSLLQDFYQRSKSNKGHWESYLEELADSLNNPEQAQKLARSMGFEYSQPQQEQVLRDLATLGNASAEELIGLLEEDLSAEIINQTLRWAELLRLSEPVGQGNWCVDPVVGRILTSFGK